MIRLERVSIAFGNKKVLQDITCTLERGDFAVIVGANGTGKTTLFDTIAGKVKPQSGAIFIGDQEVSHLNELQRAPLIGRLFQNTYLSCVPSMTVEQNLAMAFYKGRRLGLADGLDTFDRDKARALLAPLNVSFDTLLARTMGSLSGGQRQLISFVMAVMNLPQLLLLDEPTAALDPQAATSLLLFALDYLKTHTITTLLITHDPYLARAVGNKLWVLENGSIKKEFQGEEKASLNPEHLVGNLNYEALTVKSCS